MPPSPQTTAHAVPAAADAAEAAEIRFSADVVLGKAHYFVADGVVHSAEPALREVLAAIA